MKKILFALLFLVSFTVFPQSSTSSINTRITDSITTNNGRQITGAILNRLLKDMNGSYVNKTTDPYIKGATTPLSVTSNTVSIPRATASVNGYLDSADFQAFSGTSVNGPVFFAAAATTTSLSATYSANTLTLTSPLTVVDSYTIGVGDSLLFKNQTAQLQNGLYIYQSSTVLTRCTSYDETSEIYPSQINVLSGTINATKYFLQTAVDPVVGTDAIVFVSTTTPVSTNIGNSNLNQTNANRVFQTTTGNFLMTGTTGTFTFNKANVVINGTTSLKLNGNTVKTGTGVLSLSTYSLTSTANGTIGGTNTGDQTITLTGDVTGSGTSTITATVVISVQTATTLTITPTTADDFVTENSLSGAIVIANPTGTWVEGQTCLIRIKDDGTARAITFGGNYVAFGAALPTTTTISKWLMIGLVYNAIDSKWSTWSSVQQ